MTPGRAFELCQELEWEQIASSDRHVLMRTSLGEWLILPRADEPYGSALNTCFGRAVTRGLSEKIGWALGTMKKANRIQLWGFACVGTAVVLMSFSAFEEFTKGKVHGGGDDLPWWWMWASLLVLGPAAFWFGRKVVSPRVMKPLPAHKGPFWH